MKRNFTFLALLISLGLLMGSSGKTAAQTYCAPTTTFGCGDDYVQSFSTTGGVTNITNNNTGCTGNSYMDYTATQGHSDVQGNTVNFSFSNCPGWSEGYKIWVDWNADGDFNDAGEEVYASSSTIPGGGSASGSFTIPATALAGTTRLRIRCVFSSTSFDACSNESFGEIEDYGFTVIASQPCTSATFPGSVGAVIDRDTLCVSGDVQLNLNSIFAFSGITYQWESAASASGPWTNVGSAQNTPSLAVNNVSSNTWYRCQVLCNGTPAVTSTTVDVHVSNPQLTGAQGGTRCGPGTVAMSATASSGYNLNWYDVPTGGLPLGTGTNFTTPYITQTTDFYVAAATGAGSGAMDSLVAGTSGGNSCGGGVMFDITPTVSINIDSFAAQAANSGSVINVYYRVGSYVGNETNAGAWILWTTISGNYSSGLLTIPLSSALQLNAGTTYGIYLNYYSTYTTGAQTFTNADMTLDAGVGLCSDFGGVNNPRYYNGTVYYHKAGCEGARQAVTATVTPGPAFSISYDTVVCNDAVTAISVSSPLSNYTAGYTWEPVDPTDVLYADAAGTVPYTAGTNTATVYFRSDVVGMHRVAVHASNGPAQTDCAAADTADIWVQPGNIVLNGMPDTICVSGSSELTLDPDDNYAAGTIQWQVSNDGVSYTDISGATGINYTTPVLGVSSTDLYYRAIISAVAGTCETPSIDIKIADPALLSTKDSFHCGPGVVTLEATAGQNSEIRWFEDPDGGQPIGTGSPFQTPYLTETDTFYVAAGTGYASSGADSVNVPLATGSTTGIYQHMFTIKALNPLNINSFGIKCNNSAGTVTGWDIYYRPDDYTTVPGANTSSAGWILISSEPNIISAGSGTYTEIASGLNIMIPSGQTYSFYISPASGTTHQYSSASQGTVVASNADAELRAGNRGSGLFNCTTSGGMATVNVKYGGGTGCESPRELVIAHIYANPDIDLGPDINGCIDSGMAVVLDAGLPPYNPQYLWEDGSTNRVRAVDTSGIYSVTVTNSYGCAGSDTIGIMLRNNPVVDLGKDTSVCDGVVVTLDGGDDGIEYFWNTGETTREINVDVGGTYAVMVTNDQGCIKTDTIDIVMSGNLPSIDYIIPYNNGAYTFTYSAANPQNVTGYDWDFGDGSPHRYTPSPTHTYAAAGNYIVTLKISSLCGYVIDSTAAHIVGINSISGAKDLMIYPNPSSGKVTIKVAGDLVMEQIAVYDVLGKEVLNVKADNPKVQSLQLNTLASGLYSIKVRTDKGNVVKKLELIR